MQAPCKAFEELVKNIDEWSPRPSRREKHHHRVLPSMSIAALCCREGLEPLKKMRVAKAEVKIESEQTKVEKYKLSK